MGTTSKHATDELSGGFTISNRRYIGGKSLLVPEIFQSIPAHVPRELFCDIFAGTGVVGSAALGNFDSVIFNDFLFSNEIVYQGFYGRGSFSAIKLVTFRDDMRCAMFSQSKPNYFSKNFGGKYFSPKAARAIGFIREAIDQNSHGLNSREQAIVLASLIYSCDRIANTVGHYEAYRKNVQEFKEFEFKLINPREASKVKIFREDANELTRKTAANVFYVDPPYNSRQYSRFYHVLENLVKWEKPRLAGVALKPPTENVSEYCKTGAANAFGDLIGHIQGELIIVSYNNTYESKSSSSRNKITLEQISDIMHSKGKTKIKEISHKHFSAGNTDFDNHLELLFVTEVR